MGNGEAKELICTTHGHELRGEMLEVMGIPGRRGKGEKLDNCNIIINKIYLIKNNNFFKTENLKGKHPDFSSVQRVPNCKQGTM